MPRKGENIYKRKDGRWEGRYIGCYDENHKAKYVYIYGKTYTEVKQKLAIERGRQKQHVPAEKKQITDILDMVKLVMFYKPMNIIHQLTTVLLSCAAMVFLIFFRIPESAKF